MSLSPEPIAANLKIPPTVLFLRVNKGIRFFSFLGTGLIEGEEERDLASLGYLGGKMGEGPQKKKEAQKTALIPKGSSQDPKALSHFPGLKSLVPVPWRGGAVSPLLLDTTPFCGLKGSRYTSERSGKGIVHTHSHMHNNLTQIPCHTHYHPRQHMLTSQEMTQSLSHAETHTHTYSLTDIYSTHSVTHIHTETQPHIL